MKLAEIDTNKKALDQLLLCRGNLVPFLGAGFSRPACPTWADFLEQYFQDICDEFLLPEDEAEYLKLKNSQADNKFELLADWLISRSQRRRFEEELRAQFDKPLLPEMRNKFELLHRAFPQLKITSNLDTLIETSATGCHVQVCRGNQPGELERLFTLSHQNALLKIHGDLRDIGSIVLSKHQYARLYGDDTSFDPNAPLPKFLARVFTNASVLFIGCSLHTDRTLMVLASLDDVKPHFAVMLRPTERAELVALNRRLSQLRVHPIWIDDFGQIEELLGLLAPAAKIQPVPPPLDHGVIFVGREKELKMMKQRILDSNGGIQVISGQLFNLDGAGGVGKTTLAIEVAKQCASHFKDGVLQPIRVDEHNPISFATHLAGQLNEKIDEPSDDDTAQRLVTALLKDRQALLIYDNATDWQQLRYMLPFQTRCTIIITTRNRDLYRHLQQGCREFSLAEIPLKHFTEQEALDLFQQMLAHDFKPEEREVYLGIARNLGFLPLALRQAISLMIFAPHYPARELLDKLNSEDRLALLRKGQTSEGSDSRTIETVFDLSSPLLTPDLIETMEYLAACAPGPTPLCFLRQLSKSRAIDENLEQLHTYSWCDRREIGNQRFYELHQLVRDLVWQRFGRRFGERFMALVHEIFTDENRSFQEKEALLPQLFEAFWWAKKNKDERLINWMYPLGLFCQRRGHSHFYVELTEAIELLFPENKKALASALGNRALILNAWGRLDEAMALLQKQEQICTELGDRAGLATCYGNQANIHYLQGRLDEAMALFKKIEQIFAELGVRAGLATCYGNQALILNAWGRLDEAMALHQKQEQICTELGDRAGLATCYGNQALILNAWGQLEEAMALHQKEEQICTELGDRAGLARSYGNQALILQDWGRLEEAIVLLQKQEQICTKLGDRAGLATCYGNQALILQDWGRLEEAMALHQREEQIKSELGDRAGLARTWWNQGIIYGKKGDKKRQIELWRKAIATNKAIGIPTEKWEWALAEL
jgi:tetratricopeptide (TPR) repeat protein